MRWRREGGGYSIGSLGTPADWAPTRTTRAAMLAKTRVVSALSQSASVPANLKCEPQLQHSELTNFNQDLTPQLKLET